MFLVTPFNPLKNSGPPSKIIPKYGKWKFLTFIKEDIPQPSFKPFKAPYVLLKKIEVPPFLPKWTFGVLGQCSRPDFKLIVSTSENIVNNILNTCEKILNSINVKKRTSITTEKTS